MQRAQFVEPVDGIPRSPHVQPCAPTKFCTTRTHARWLRRATFTLDVLTISNVEWCPVVRWVAPIWCDTGHKKRRSLGEDYGHTEDRFRLSGAVSVLFCVWWRCFPIPGPKVSQETSPGWISSVWFGCSVVFIELLVGPSQRTSLSKSRLRSSHLAPLLTTTRRGICCYPTTGRAASPRRNALEN